MTPTNQFTPLSVALARNGQNLAPALPLAEAFRNKKLSEHPTKFEVAVRKKYSAYLAYEKVSRDEAISLGQLCSKFINGDQLLRPNPFGVPGYYVQPVAGDDTYTQRAMNMMRFYYQCCETKFTSANPTVTMRPGGDEPIDIATAQSARPVVDYRESQFYTSKFSRRECLYAATNGIFIHRVRWNPFKGEWMAQYREAGEQSVQLDDEGLGECAECQLQAPAKEFPETEFGDQCPQCGSAAVDVQRPQPQSLPQVSMGQSKPIGEPEIIQTPFAAWAWDMSKDLEESTWAIYRQRVTPGSIRLIIGDAIIPDTKSSDDRSLDVLHSNAYSGQAFGGNTGVSQRRDNDNRPTMAEFWMSQEDYADIDLEEGETVSGHKLPAGKMGDVFKDPICIVGLNDMSMIIGTYANETHRDEVVTGQWFMKSDSGGGRGMQDSVAVQKRFNAVDGQVYQGLAGTATPAVVTDLRLMKEDQSGYLFKPNTTIDINLSMLPPGLGLKDAFYLGTPGNVNQQYIQYGSVFLKDMFQVSSLVTEFSDFMSIDNRTATGAQITSALANSLFGPMLLTKGESRVRIAKIIVRLEAKYGSVSRYFPGKDNARGRNVGGSDLRGKVIYELEQNSELPVTPFSKQTDIRALIESLGGIEGVLMLKSADPAMFRSFVAPYNVKIESESDDVISTICLERFEQMKANFEAGVDDPQMLVEGLRPPVSVFEPKQKQKAEWWSDFLDLDTSRRLPMGLRVAAEQMIVKHENSDTERQLPQAVNSGLVNAAAQAPAALGAAALQGQEQTDAPPEDKSKEIQADVAMEQLKQETALKMKGMEGETQRSVAHIQGENAAESARIAGENQLKVERAKPKPKPAAKAAA